jgi:hypothetical protein
MGEESDDPPGDWKFFLFKVANYKFLNRIGHDKASVTIASITEEISLHSNRFGEDGRFHRHRHGFYENQVYLQSVGRFLTFTGRPPGLFSGRFILYEEFRIQS